MSVTLDVSLPTVGSTSETYAITSTSQTLADEVMRIVQDASYDYSTILDLFNDCLMYLAGKYFIPDLEMWAEVLTDPSTNHLRLPADFHRELRYCHSIDHNRQIKIHGSVSQMFRLFSVLDQSGNIIGVAVKGRDLYYQRVPGTAETLKLNYYRVPERMVSRHDKPVCIPWHIAKRLLKHYALKEIYSEIEDGIEDKQANSMRQESKFATAEAELVAFLGPQERPPVEIEDEICWEEMA